MCLSKQRKYTIQDGKRCIDGIPVPSPKLSSEDELKQCRDLRRGLTFKFKRYKQLNTEPIPLENK